MHTVVSSKGQVVIPLKIREEMDLSPGELLEVSLHGQSLILSKNESGLDQWLMARKRRSALKKPLVVDRPEEMPPAPKL